MATPHGLVSVVIPFFDEERFLGEAIESVLKQSFDGWEILLVDDGSRDRSSAIAKAYASDRPESIRCLEHENHENRGLAATRNLGIAAARGEFVALLDADDVWHSNKLAYQLEIMRLHPELGMICSASLSWSSWADAGKRDRVVQVGGPQDEVVESPRLLKELYPLKRGQRPPCPSSLFLRRSAIQKVGGFEESFSGAYQLYEDQAFLSKVYLCEKVYIASECLIRYRRRSNSLTATIEGAGRYAEVRGFFLDWFEEYLQRTGVRDRKIRRLLRKALRPYRHPRLHRWMHVAPKAIRKKARSLRRRIARAGRQAGERVS